MPTQSSSPVTASEPPGPIDPTPANDRLKLWLAGSLEAFQQPDPPGVARTPEELLRAEPQTPGPLPFPSPDPTAALLAEVAELRRQLAQTAPHPAGADDLPPHPGPKPVYVPDQIPLITNSPLRTIYRTLLGPERWKVGPTGWPTAADAGGTSLVMVPRAVRPDGYETHLPAPTETALDTAWAAVHGLNPRVTITIITALAMWLEAYRSPAARAGQQWHLAGLDAFLTYRGLTKHPGRGHRPTRRAELAAQLALTADVLMTVQDRPWVTNEHGQRRRLTTHANGPLLELRDERPTATRFRFGRWLAPYFTDYGLQLAALPRTALALHVDREPFLFPLGVGAVSYLRANQKHPQPIELRAFLDWCGITPPAGRQHPERVYPRLLRDLTRLPELGFAGALDPIDLPDPITWKPAADVAPAHWCPWLLHRRFRLLPIPPAAPMPPPGTTTPATPPIGQVLSAAHTRT